MSNTVDQSPTLFYGIFEKTLNQFKNVFSTKISVAPNSAPSMSKSTAPSMSNSVPPGIETNIEKIKPILNKIKGTKLYYMVRRYENEKMFVYV